ncbi:MAG TPA: hypothetical protein VH305_09795 [Gaiella sp.]
MTETEKPSAPKAAAPGSRKKAPAARPAPHAKPAKATAPARIAPVPRDGSRLGLPIGTLTLSVVSHESSRNALLAAAALLLLAASAGGLVVGIAGRRLTRIA